MIRALILALVVLLTGCATYTPDLLEGPLPGQFGAPCGINASGFDSGDCSPGLECFGVCTFECGQKYSADGEYGLDVASVDRCAALGGSCQGYAPGVDINVCRVPE